MYCENCGTKYYLNACPNCGHKNTSTQVSNANLLIERPSSFIGIAISIKVVVDGTREFDLPNDFKIELNLAPGEHIITYKVWSRRTQEVRINVVPGKKYYIKFKPDFLWGGFKLDSSSILE